MRGTLDKLELMFYIGADYLEIIFQVDRRATDLMTSLEEALELDKKTFRMTVTGEDIQGGDEEVEKKLSDLIHEYAG